MKICIFGANGRTGQHVVDEALRRHHKVQAFVHRKNQAMPPAVTVFEGDVLDAATVDKAITGCDAVISVLGHVKNSDPRMQTKGIQNIVNSMKEKGITRIISLTGTGVRQKGDRPSIIDHMLNLTISLIDPDRVKDGKQHAEVLRKSDLEWTILRVLKLTQSKTKLLNYQLTTGGPAELFTSRKKVAAILLDILEKNIHVRAMPVSSRVPSAS